jgi:dihydroxyacid dehydratase/phosphogluconate dehydratase
VNGDEVTVRPEAAGGVGMVFKVRDSDTISMDMGFAALTLKRVN